MINDKFPLPVEADRKKRMNDTPAIDYFVITSNNNLFNIQAELYLNKR